MNQSPHFRPRPFFGTFLAAAGLFIAGQSAAQDYALLTNKPQATAPVKELNRPFWVMTTAPGADSTMVAFYTPGNQKMYEEKLPNQAVQLTKKTTRTLNETIDRLMSMNAAATTIPANTLAEALMGKSLLQIGTYASRDGVHLNLMMDNPDFEFVAIELLDKAGHTVYQTSTRQTKARFKFDMEGMPDGQYQLRVSTKKQRFERDLAFSHPEPVPGLLIQSLELRVAKK